MRYFVLLLFAFSLGFSSVLFASETDCWLNQAYEVKFQNVKPNNCLGMAKSTKSKMIEQCGVDAERILIQGIKLKASKITGLSRSPYHAFIIVDGQVGIDPSGTITPHLFDAKPGSPEISRIGTLTQRIE